jgi:general secretion pathway protein B
MSYILEALRRAESERERKRGGVPGLHAQPVPMPSLDDAHSRRTPWGWITAAVSAGVLLLILWRWWSAEPLVDEAALARAPVGGNVSQGSAEPAPTPAPPPEPAAAPAPAAAPSPAPPPPAPAPAARAKTPPAAREKAPRTTKPATPPRSSATAAAPRRDADAKAPAATPAPPNATAPATADTAPRPAAPPPPPPPAPVPERLPKLAELPDELRRSVPQLAFGGSVYSDTPAQRMVIFNNQVMREGDAVTNEVQIEQIRPRSAVMRVRGQRFEMVF